MATQYFVQRWRAFEASRQDFDPTDYQPILFCADSFDAMYQTLRDYLVRWEVSLGNKIIFRDLD